MEIKAQTNNTRSTAPFSLESKSDTISRFRRILIDRIISADTAKAGDLLRSSLKSIEDSHYIVLYPMEMEMILFWLHDFDALPNTILAMDSAAWIDLRNRITPQKDQLFAILSQTIVKEKLRISYAIMASERLTAEDQRFLELNLERFTTESENNNQYQEIINSRAGTFLKEFPGSRYDNYVRRYIRYSYEQHGFVMAFELFSGAVILSSKTNSYFNSSGALGLGYSFGWNRVRLNGRVAAVFSKLKQDIDVNGKIWSNGKHANLTVGELSLGYAFTPAKNITLTPFCGLGWFSSSPVQKDQDQDAQLKDVSVSSKGRSVFGIDLGFGKPHFVYNPSFSRRLLYEVVSVNFRYSVQPLNFPSRYGAMNGWCHNISLACHFGWHNTRRIY